MSDKNKIASAQAYLVKIVSSYKVRLLVIMMIIYNELTDLT